MTQRQKETVAAVMPWIPIAGSLLSSVFVAGVVWSSMRDLPAKVDRLERRVSVLCQVVRITYRSTTPAESRIEFGCNDAPGVARR